MDDDPRRIRNSLANSLARIRAELAKVACVPNVACAGDLRLDFSDNTIIPQPACGASTYAIPCVIAKGRKDDFTDAFDATALAEVALARDDELPSIGKWHRVHKRQLFGA